jgi:Zn-dependent protease with chaperone function
MTSAPISGPATYFDGRRPVPTPVHLVWTAKGLSVSDASGQRLAEWPGGHVRRVDAMGPILRLALQDGSDARIEVTDPALVDALRKMRPAIPVLGSLDSTGRWRLAGLAVAAVVSVTLFVIWGLPAIATQVALRVPPSVEVRIGESVRPQILDMLGVDADAPGSVCRQPAGLAALQQITGPMLGAVPSEFQVKVDVINHPMPNAFALPGGQVLIMRGLLDRARSAEAVAGVVAHELGHVHHRDGMRKLAESVGLSVVFGVVLGDFTGSTLAIAVAKGLVDARYSREAERRADAYAVTLLGQLNRPASDLADALDDITAGEGGGASGGGLLTWWSSHPEIPERTAVLRSSPKQGTPRPLLSASEWQALRAICGSRP